MDWVRFLGGMDLNGYQVGGVVKVANLNTRPKYSA